MPRVPTGECQSQKIGHVLEYWDTLARQGQLPRRQSVSPLGLGAAVLPHAFIVENTAEIGCYRFRLGGSQLCAKIGEVKGKAVQALLPDLLVPFREATELAWRGRKPVTGIDLFVREGFNDIEFEWLLAPLDNGFGAPCFLGVAVCTEAQAMRQNVPAAALA